MKRLNHRIPRSRFTELNQLSITIHLGSYVIQPLWWGFSEAKWWRNFLHTHSFFEVCYAYSGRGVLRILGTDQAVKTGDVFVAKPGEPHEIISDRKKPLGIYFWAFTLVRAKGHSQRAAPVDSLLDAFSRCTSHLNHNAGTMKHTLKLLTDEVAKRAPGFSIAIDGLIAKLILETARAVVEEQLPAERPNAPAMSTDQSIVNTACRYVDDNFSRPIGVRDIAAQVHVSERHLSRLIKRGLGTTVKDYVTTARMKAAAQMLLDHHSTVKQVAIAVGYPDVRYFTTLFRKRTGLTPAVFRQRRGTSFRKRERN